MTRSSKPLNLFFPSFQHHFTLRTKIEKKKIQNLHRMLCEWSKLVYLRIEVASMHPASTSVIIYSLCLQDVGEDDLYPCFSVLLSSTIFLLLRPSLPRSGLAQTDRLTHCLWRRKAGGLGVPLVSGPPAEPVAG